MVIIGRHSPTESRNRDLQFPTRKAKEIMKNHPHAHGRSLLEMT